MLDVLYFTFIACSLGYFVLSPRKEFPLLLLLHAVLQYGVTQLMWLGQSDQRVAGLLLLFVLLSSALLIWGRSLAYSRELFSVRAFVTVSQWLVLLAIALQLWLQRPDSVVMPSTGWHPPVRLSGILLGTLPKLGANFFLFTLVLQVVLGWGQRWPLRRSLLDILPVVLYWVLTISALRYLSSLGGYLVS